MSAQGLIGGPCADPPAQVWALVGSLSGLGTFNITASGDGRLATVSSAGTGAEGLNYPGAWILIRDVDNVNALLFRRSERGSDRWHVAAFIETLPDLTQASYSRAPSTANASVIFDDAYPLFANGTQQEVMFLQTDSPYGFVYNAIDPTSRRTTTSIVWNPDSSYLLIAQRVLPESSVDATRYRKVYPMGRRQVPRTIQA